MKGIVHTTGAAEIVDSSSRNDRGRNSAVDEPSSSISDGETRAQRRVRHVEGILVPHI